MQMSLALSLSVLQQAMNQVMLHLYVQSSIEWDLEGKKL